MIISAYRKCKIMYLHVSQLWAKESSHWHHSTAWGQLPYLAYLVSVFEPQPLLYHTETGVHISIRSARVTISSHSNQSPWIWPHCIPNNAIKRRKPLFTPCQAFIHLLPCLRANMTQHVKCLAPTESCLWNNVFFLYSFL